MRRSIPNQCRTSAEKQAKFSPATYSRIMSRESHPHDLATLWAPRNLFVHLISLKRSCQSWSNVLSSSWECDFLLDGRLYDVKTADELDAQIRDILALYFLEPGDQIGGILYVDYADESVKQASLVAML